MNVKITDARFAGTAYDRLEPLDEIAFVGRSNVGKSSLINALLRRKRLVKTSKQPGKTRSVNFFRVDFKGIPSFYMVDLPGYGYARVSKSSKEEWVHVINSYFEETKDLRLVFLLMDIRRDLRDEEFYALEMARNIGTPCILVATKADKVGTSMRKGRILAIEQTSGMRPVACSALTGLGLDILWKAILDSTRKNKAKST